MQVQSIKNVNFTSGRLTPEALEERAMRLENNEGDDFAIKPEAVADMLDGKLKKTETGRKTINFVVSAASFAAAALSFKKVAPKLRHGVATATSRVAGKFANLGKKVSSEGINQIGSEMQKESSKIASKGDGTIIKRVAIKVFGDKNGNKVINGLKQAGIETGGDVADTAIAVGAAVLAGREAGDIADETQKEHTLKDALGDLTKVVNAIPGVDILPE